MKVNKWDFTGDRYVFCISDLHALEYDKSSFNILLKHASKYPKIKTALIINGDFLDLWFFMKKHPLYKRWIKRGDGIDEFFSPKFDEEMSWGNDRLDELSEVFGSIIYIRGNHSAKRYFEFLDLIPDDSKHRFNIKEKLNLKGRGIFMVNYNDYLDVKDWTFSHGQWCGASALRKHYLSCAKNICIGHLHNLGVQSFESRGKTRKAISLPAMCKMPNSETMKYMENRDNRWSIGYGLLTIIQDKTFFNVFEINDGELAIGEELISGKA